MKKITLGLSLLGLIFAGCSNQEDPGNNTETNPKVINFAASTSRASVNKLTQVESGFPVYAMKGDAPSTWYISGDTYLKSAGVWGWQTVAANHNWPTTTSGYPMNFYAFYPAIATGFTPSTATAGALTAAVVVQTSRTSQTDYLATKYEDVQSKPGSGALNLSFKHIMTKIDMGIIPGTGATVYVNQLGIKNVASQGTYDYVAQSWSVTNTYTDTYDYISGNDAVFVASTSNTPNPVYTGEHSNHLMLMPQASTPSFKPSTPSAAPSNGYISCLYRIETVDNVNSVGFKNATSHPAYATSGSTYTGPLYIKVAFPLSTTPLASPVFTWEAGKGYTYNIKLGTPDASGGYLDDGKYYDDNGNPTNLDVVPGNKQPGDPISSGIINFEVVVEDWNEQTPSEIL